ncbi:MAG TPA: nuclear transport factor 2 family protein [Steroidobacteraceae bacterium]|nr:nuclear transport factor 2 family protein [Steroidobacteraceae bacterium]
MSTAPRAAALLSRLAFLEVQTARLHAASCVKRLQRALGYYLDRALWDEAAQLFSEDATLEMGLDGVYRGSERIRQYLYALGGGRSGVQPGRLHEWFQLQPVVSVAADARSAKGRWRAFILAGELGGQALWGEGPYECEYESVRGVWKIARLHWYQTFIVPYEGGWSAHRDCTGGKLIAATLPPDEPPSERYETWPGVHVPSFHYQQPAEVLKAAAQAAAAPGIDGAEADLLRAIAWAERRLMRLHDAQQIENLISAYGYYLDKQQWDQLAELFATDATMEISQRGVYAGRTSIRRALELFGPQGIEANHLHNHQQWQPLIHVAIDGSRAWARSRAFGQLGTYQGPALWHGGVYENEFVNEDGRWRFKRDHVYTTYFARYAEGWMSGPRPAARPSDRIPPDGPPSEVYEAFPEVYVPPFHYAHPVTGRPIQAGGSGASEYRAAANEGTERSGELRAHELSGELAHLARRLSSIGATLARLADERAIENLQRSYGYFVDKALWNEAADLFAADGTLEIGGRGVFVGRERVLQYLRWLEPRGLTRGKLFEHIQLQPIVTIAPEGERAQGRWRFFAQVGEYQRYALWGLGTYENEYVKEDGVWKLKTLHSFFRMYAPYADGWAKNPLPNTRPEQELPPDRPPTVPHELFPAPFTPDHHYRNPGL